MELNLITIALIVKAFEQHGTDIVPASGCGRFRDSITIVNNRRLLWYNTPNKSTRVSYLPIQKLNPVSEAL